ncbi:MAG: molecular chaperone DnaJ [Candidatus Thermoplasmatota archaeon]|nr:molecular chaperone DnaJ [Candidatus Thermoplasmatota archaeon]
MDKRDYYEVLGIGKGAGADEIKQAYRKLALKHHPDRVPAEEKKNAEEKFKEISEAYAVLSDEQKRSQYNQYGHAGIDQRYSYEDIFRGANFSDFSDIFRNMGFGGGGFGFSGADIFDTFFGGGRRSRQPRRGEDIEFHVSITLDDAAKGVEKEIEVPRTERCETCGGSGAKQGTRKSPCPKCHGSGQIQYVRRAGFMQFSQVITCDRCNGRGQIIETPCGECRGSGYVQRRRKINVKIPQGVDNGSVLRMREEGEHGEGGPGDLFVVIRVKEHPTILREGNDLYVDAPLSFAQAAMGGKVEVETIDGFESVKVPSGTQSHTRTRVHGKGMPILGRHGRGDLIVKFVVKTPEKLTRRQKELLEEFEKEPKS